MTAEQAINILDNIVAQVQLSRRDHEIVIEAIVLLRNITNGDDVKDKEPSNEEEVTNGN